MKKKDDYTIELVLLVLIIACMASCTSFKISSKPTRRQESRGMKYSTWEYAQPKIETNLTQYYDPK